MNIQEQEELDYQMGAMDELQNAYALSKMETQLVDPKIEEERLKGKIVVFCSATAYCPRTDAILGEERNHIASFDTEVEAKEYIQTLRERMGEFDEEMDYFHTEPTVTEPVKVQQETEEIPF